MSDYTNNRFGKNHESNDRNGHASNSRRDGGFQNQRNAQGSYHQNGYTRNSRNGEDNRTGYRPTRSSEGFGSQRKSYNPNFSGNNRPYANRDGEQRFGRYPRPADGNRFGKAAPYADRRFRPNGGSNPFATNGEDTPGYKRYGAAQGIGRRSEQGNFQRPAGRGQRPQSQHRPVQYKDKPFDPNEPVRLNKFLANSGVCSRRDADKYIESGVVTVNGKVVTELGTKVLRSDVVLFHDQAVKMEKKVYVLLNKPKGYVTTSEDPQNRKTVMDLVAKACMERIYPVGRLDRNTTGVLLLTNDGEMASKLTHPKFLKKKIYHVHTDKNVTLADLQQIAAGITLEDGEIRADAVEYASPTDKKQVGIEIHSGKNRIVRRIFEHFGYQVVKLDRVYFAGLTKKNLRRGDWRHLSEKEVDMLRMGAFE